MPTSASVTTYDPIRAFKFQVEIIGGANGTIPPLGFQKISGLKTSTDVVEYREGNQFVHKMKLPGLTNYEPVTMSRGAGPSGVAKQLLDWRYQVAGYGSGEVNHDGIPISPANGRFENTSFRRRVTINVYDKGISTDGRSPDKVYDVYMAWPSEISISDLNAEASEVLIESIVLQHEGLDLVDAEHVQQATGR
jgi:phage tail-like protein